MAKKYKYNTFAERFATGNSLMSQAIKEAIEYIMTHNVTPEMMARIDAFRLGQVQCRLILSVDNTGFTGNGNAAQLAADLIDDGAWSDISSILEAADDIRSVQ